MKPFWKGTLKVLKVICKFVTWLISQPNDENKDK